MADGLDFAAIALSLVPVAIKIAISLVEGKNPAEMDQQEAAAIALFNALLAYLEVAL